MKLPPGWPKRSWRDWVAAWLTRPGLLRPVFALLRRFAPVLKLGKKVVVSRHADVVDVLTRDTDFTIAEVNAPTMERWNGPFILGTDRGEVYDREAGALHRAAPVADLPRVRAMVVAAAGELIDATRSRGRIDAVGDFSRVVPTRIVANYLGVPGPDEETTMHWLRALFDAVFIDTSPRARQTADLAAAAQRPYMLNLIAQRRQQLADGETLPDDVLSRLVMMGTAEPWLDDDAVRRCINGVIVGAVDTTSKAVAHVIDELLRRSDAFEGARRAALSDDIDSVQGYAWEALRFLPHGPVLQRHCPRDTTIGHTATRVASGSTVILGTMSAMFDGSVFPEPASFRSTRPVEAYLHFGHGMHTCFGANINSVQIPELVAALLRLPNLRRAEGRAGRLAYDGPFPDRLLLDFDRH